MPHLYIGKTVAGRRLRHYSHPALAMPGSGAQATAATLTAHSRFHKARAVLPPPCSDADAAALAAEQPSRAGAERGPGGRSRDTTSHDLVGLDAPARTKAGVAHLLFAHKRISIVPSGGRRRNRLRRGRRYLKALVLPVDFPQLLRQGRSSLLWGARLRAAARRGSASWSVRRSPSRGGKTSPTRGLVRVRARRGRASRSASHRRRGFGRARAGVPGWRDGACRRPARLTGRRAARPGSGAASRRRPG